MIISALLMLLLRVISASVVSASDDAFPVLATTRSTSEVCRLLLKTADGDLILVAGDSGAIMWRVASEKPIVVTMSPSPDAAVEFANHVIVPGLDGTLFFVHDHTFDPLQVHAFIPLLFIPLYFLR